MKQLSRDEFSELLKAHRISRRLIRELRFVPENIDNWQERELLAVATKSGNEGVLLIQLNDADETVLIPYELMVGIKDTQTGRTRSVLCDFCVTWQPGGAAGRITFTRPSDAHKLTYLCCADLDCSQHVRGLTAAAAMSRTQLHEDITPQARIDRFRVRLSGVVQDIGLGT